MKIKKKYHFCIYCLQELESRGEKFQVCINEEDDNENQVCDFCKEETDPNEIKTITF